MKIDETPIRVHSEDLGQSLVDWFADPPPKDVVGPPVPAHDLTPEPVRDRTVSIHIGRVEVRAAPPSDDGTPAPRFQPRLSLDRYLRERRAGRR